MVVEEVGGTRTGQCLPGNRPGIHNELIIMKLVLVLGLMARIVGPLRSREARFVPFDRYGFNGV